jgi:hypothetical protein
MLEFLAQNWEIISGIIIVLSGMFLRKWISEENVRKIVLVIGQIIELVEKKQKPVVAGVILDELKEKAKVDPVALSVYRKIEKSPEKNEAIINKVIVAKNIAVEVGEAVNDAKKLSKFAIALWKGVKKIL